MPYFYKISDYFTYEKDWLDKVYFTVDDFTEGCHEKRKGDVIILILKLSSEDNIQPHISDINMPEMNEFEYIIPNKVSSTKIIGKGNFKESTFESKLMNFKNRRDIDKLYIHITCKKNEASIRDRGLSHDVSSSNKIGDRGSGKNKRKKEKKKTRRLLKKKGNKSRNQRKI